MECYLDNSATTRCFDEVAQLMVKIMCEDYGNPSSMHTKGMEAEKYVRTAAEDIARTLKVDPKEILFTSGGTESDNLALMGVARANVRAGKHIITTCVEHPAILSTCEYLESCGYEITYLSVDSIGRISLEELEQAIRPDTILVSIMHTNNEIGSVMPIAEAGALIKKKNKNTLFHVDAVQGYGKAVIRPRKMNIDLLSVSAHKIHGPKGIGFLYIADKTKIRPILFGGGQQKGMRSGTENVAGIAGMALAAKMIHNGLEKELDDLYEKKARLIEGLSSLPEVQINGLTGRDSAPHVVSASFRGVRAEVLLHALEDKGVYASAGSACASNKPETAGSATLRAIGLEKDLLDSTLRFSLSVMTTEEEIDAAIEALQSLLPMLRRFTRR